MGEVRRKESDYVDGRSVVAGLKFGACRHERSTPVHIKVPIPSMRIGIARCRSGSDGMAYISSAVGHVAARLYKPRSHELARRPDNAAQANECFLRDHTPELVCQRLLSA